MQKNMNSVKKIVAGVLAIAMLVAGITVRPKTADAAGEYKDEIVYEDRTSEFSLSWKAGKTPEKAGYVFGGWYEKTGEGSYKSIDSITAASKADDTSITEGICAKFVPAYVMSVKAQIDADTTGADDGIGACLRVMSSVDSLDYQTVGFTILLNNSIDVSTVYNDGNALEATKVYDGLVVTEGDTEKTLYAKDIFGTQSEYLSVWRLNDIVDANDAKIIYVRPYWVTCDGTRVEGLAKYIHVEDSYNNYISVPVNLYQNKDVAAGVLQMSYNSEYFTVHDVEYGKVFEEMEYNSGLDGALMFVGNKSEIESVTANGLYVNVRFALTETGKANYQGVGTGKFLSFEVGSEEFSNWDEETVTIDSWDVQY